MRYTSQDNLGGLMGTIARSGTVDDNAIRMPKNTVDTRVSPMSLDYLISNYESYLEDNDRGRYPWATRFVLGFPLPDWQRGFVWTDLQQTRFITSVWMHGDIGSYMVNHWEMTDGTTFDKFSSILLDGQQRLTTIERYITNQLAINDIDGVPRLWNELSKREQRRFGNCIFSKCETRLWDEHALKEVYDLRNFAGTPHLESERALPAA
jgi:hypothetical protein